MTGVSTWRLDTVQQDHKHSGRVSLTCMLKERTNDGKIQIISGHDDWQS